jgi:hypothetical protein
MQALSGTAGLLVGLVVDLSVGGVWWVTADEAYGGDPSLRCLLEGRGVSYVLAVKRTEPMTVSGRDRPGRASAEQLVAAVPAEQWVTASAGMVRAEQSLASLKDLFEQVTGVA